jgi:hypothetical protein
METREKKREANRNKKVDDVLFHLESLASMYDNPTQAALIPYIAGIIDGEGTIRISKSKIRRSWNFTYNSMMSCGMSDERVPKLLCKILGGSVREERVANLKWKSIWRWNLTGRVQTYAALKMIQPFLIVKQEQAALMISFCEGFEKAKRYHHLWIINDKQLQWREDMYLQMRKLNAVGAGATTKRVGIREDEAIV